MKINYKRLIGYIVITFVIGSLFAIFISNSDGYQSLNKSFEVPGIVFPIVWSILFLIMGISAYIVDTSHDKGSNNAIKLYFIQLIVNSLWTLIFFGFNLYTLGFIWIILLIVLVIAMIIKFYNINKVAGFINIPYLLWLFFALYLSFDIMLLN